MNRYYNGETNLGGFELNPQLFFETIILEEEEDKMESDELVAMAKKRFFKGPDNDFSARVAQETLIIGLARLLSLQKYLGYDTDAIMVCFPGTTPTGGTDRLQRGYSLGTVLRYNYLITNSRKDPLIILDPKSNCCGVLIGSFNSDFPTKEKLRDKVSKLIQKDPRIKGVRILVEKYFVGNHFINTYQESSFVGEDRYWIAIHGSGEMRKDSSLGMGIYIDESQELQSIARRHDTLIGPIHYLLGDEAITFMTQYRKAEEFSTESREYLAKQIIPDLEVLCNVSHLTITEPGSYFCGIYNIIHGQIYPFLINRNDGIVLMRARKNFSLRSIDILGWTKQTIQTDTQIVLQSINGLPHGGGKIYGQNEYRLVRVRFNGSKIVYTIFDGNNEFDIDSLKSLGPITYKGLDELDYIKKLGLADETGRLYFGEKGCSLNSRSWGNKNRINI